MWKMTAPASNVIEQREVIMRPSRSTWRGSGTVLVIDDEEVIRVMVTRLLERSGFDVLTAADGRAGVDVFRAYADTISVVLLDIAMPHLRGDQAFNLIRISRPDARIVLMSGYSEEDITNRIVSDSHVSVLQKPFAPDELRERMRQMLEAE